MKRETIYNIFSNIPILETDRLVLRKMKASDANDMFEYAKKSEVTRFLTWKPHPDVKYTREYLEYIATRYAVGDFYDWAVVIKGENKMIGTCGFTRFDLANNSAEIGYVLNPEYCGKGIATEAAREVVRFGFEELKLHRIEARYMSGNAASQRVMEKLGMKRDGILREAYYVHGSYKTVAVYSILSSEYR